LPAWRHLVHEALLLLAVLAACAVPSARADVTLSGAVWAGGFPDGIDQLTILDADGGSGSGSTGGGLGDADINVVRVEFGVTQRIACIGLARHPDPVKGHTSGYSSEASGQTFRGIVIAVSTPSLFRISSCASAETWSGDLEPIQPFRLTAITGALTGDGITGSMQPGTYLLEFYVGGFAPGQMPDIPDAVEAGYGALAELGVKSVGASWMLELSSTETPEADCDGNAINDACQALGDPNSDGDYFLDACEQRWGDIVLDGIVDGADLGALLVAWGTSTSGSDLNGDGIVDGADLGILLGHWGQTPWAQPGLVEMSPSSGPAAGGTPITLRGANLLGATGVTVGGVAASNVQVINATTVTAVTPAGSLGAKPVGVTTAFGTATLASAYSCLPAPTLASVSPSTGPAFGSTLITLTGTNLTGATDVTVGGVAGWIEQVVSDTTVTAWTPSGPVGGATVAITTPGGTASLAGAFTYTAVVPNWATLIEAEPDPAVVWDETLRAAIRATGWAWRVRDTATQIEMLLIPPGTFNMGCSASVQYGCNGHESPVHSVTLTLPFYLGRYEVTQAQWQARMGSNPSLFQNASAQVPAAQVPNRPVERVSWNQIAGSGGFMAAGMRLPTEAEWEYAYRAGTSTAFHGFTGYPNGTNDGTLAGSIGWQVSNSINQTRPVGGKAGNGFGLHDMAGNVFEWVSDWYSSSYYASSPATNPSGPAGGASRVFRGGSYVYDSYELRASYRNGEAPGSASNGLGFRVARSP
jgi:formylglycine-generating enzyme required for sulfatase activity